MTLTEILDHYFNIRQLKHPDFRDAILFAITELAEALEVELAQRSYVRNNPDDKPTFDKNALAEELGDVIMMIQTAGIAYKVDPLRALIDKLAKKAGLSYRLTYDLYH